jgi:hypothetical protein
MVLILVFQNLVAEIEVVVKVFGEALPLLQSIFTYIFD